MLAAPSHNILDTHSPRPSLYTFASRLQTAVCKILTALCAIFARTLPIYRYYKLSKIRLNGSHIICENGIYCSMFFENVKTTIN